MKKIYFCVPFKSKSVSTSWSEDVKSLKNLIDSIKHQSEKELLPHVVISGHDKPDFLNSEPYSSLVTFVDNSVLPLPETVYQKNNDKQLKKRSSLESIFKMVNENDLICISDADDLFHYDFLKAVKNRAFRSHISDLIFFTGYMYNRRSNRLAYIDGVNVPFYKICGTCIVSRVLPSDIDSNFIFFNKLTSHGQFYEVCLENERKPWKFTFPAVLYMYDGVLNFSSGNEYTKRLFDSYGTEFKHDFNNLENYFLWDVSS